MSVFTPSLEQRLEFAPPQAPGLLPGMVLALLVHLLLVLALTWGVRWKSQVDTPAVEAELWSAVPVEAAPPLQTPDQPPSAPTPPEPVAPPAPPPPERVQPAPPVPTISAAEIALEREKQRAKERELERQAALQAELKRKQAAHERELELQAQKEQAAKAERERQRLEAERKLQAQKDQAQKEQAKKDQALKEQAQKDAQAAKDKKAKDLADKAAADAVHAARVKQMLGMAGATGGENAAGTAQRASGPSSGYAGRIAARIKPNIVFPDDIPGNPEAVVSVRTAPDGSVIGTPVLLKSSGVRSWDEAVIKAILRTEVLPKDIDGRVPSSMELHFKPKDF